MPELVEYNDGKEILELFDLFFELKDIVNKKIDLALSNSVTDLEYIKSIDINIQDASKTGIMVEIITIEDVKKQSYHGVFNLR